jgi:hypothetical protein
MSDAETVVKLWRVLCIKENIMVDGWGIDAPTICPNAHADRTIDPTKTRMIKWVSTKKVQVDDTTSGHFQHTSLSAVIPAGTVGDVTNCDFSWPMDMDVWKTEYTPLSASLGDDVCVVVGPDAIVGGLVAPAVIGDKSLYISPATLASDEFTKGIELALDDGVNYQNIGRVTSINKNTYEIKFENALTNNYAAGTLVKINLCMVKDLHINNSGVKYQFGEKGLKFKTIPANTVVRIKYKNNDGAAKSVQFELAFYYR